jgi:hypothetical protein
MDSLSFLGKLASYDACGCKKNFIVSIPLFYDINEPKKKIE